MIVGLLALATCSPQDQPPITTSADGTVTLQLAIPDFAGVASESAVLDFIDQVETRSDGMIVVEPVWNAAGDNSETGYEVGVIAAVKDGEYPLGLAASRSWENGGVTTFQPLQTPFLIDNDALAVAVATSDVATRMLEGLSPAGITGLALWPEDMRHPFSLVADKPLLSPDDFAGAVIRAAILGVTHAMMEALGSTTTLADSGYQGAESGFLNASNSLSGRPIATGNVTFYPKYQVLFANGEAFASLSEAQQTILREAAAAARDNYLAERPSDTMAGVAWCDQGYAIVLASDTQLAALVDAVQPVVDQIEADPANAEALAALSELKANTPPGTGVAACGEVAGADDGQNWSTGLPPNGLWRVELSEDVMAGMGLVPIDVTELAGTYTLTLNDGAGKFGFENGLGAGECEGDYSAVDDLTSWVMTSGPCTATLTVTQWRLEDDGLHFRLVDIKDASFIENRAIFEAKPWQKMEE
jgi:TRAP-type C4-dicarboxylate transport system substrate-binding protein